MTGGSLRSLRDAISDVVSGLNRRIDQRSAGSNQTRCMPLVERVARIEGALTGPLATNQRLACSVR